MFERLWKDDAVLYRIACLIGIVLFFAVVAQCQHSEKHSGQTQAEWEDGMRIRIATITSVDKEANLIFLMKKLPREVMLFSVEYGDKTQLPEKLEGCILYTYCLEHHFALTVEKIDKKYCK